MISLAENSVSLSAPGFTIDQDTAEFFAKRVPHPEQQRIRRILAALADIYRSDNQDATTKRLATAMQIPFYTLRRIYWAYKSGCEKAQLTFGPGDWRSVLNWSKVRPERENLPHSFKEFWRTLGENNQRKWKPAHDELLQILRTGYDFKGRQYKKIPGYETWPVIDPVLGHPAGMSYENLIRHTSSDYDQAATRIGRQAANKFRLPVLKTRVGLRLGQFMEFDDHEFDAKVLFQKKPMRPLCFAAVDVLTDCVFKIGLKPSIWDEAEDMKRKLTEREFLWFLLAVLCNTGYRRDAIGTTLVLERGTTTVREPYLSRLQLVLGDYVKFYFGSNAGANTRAAHGGQFGGQPKGNFKTKAIVESKWNPLNNQLASLLGQVGKDRDHSPAQLYGAEKYTGQIIRAVEERNIAPELLRLPFHDYHEFCRFAHDAIYRINTARDHQCEGWEKLGFIRKQWRTDASSPLWHEEKDFELLSDIDRAVIRAKIDGPAGTDLIKVERASRLEVFQQLSRELTQLPLYRIPEIVGPELALRSAGGGEQLLTVRNGLLSFDCAEIDTDTLEFHAKDQQSPAGHYFPNGQKFVCFVNPYLPTHLIACDEKLRVQAVCPRYERAHDEASLNRNLGAQAAMEGAQRVRLNLRHDDETRTKQAMQAHNTIVLARKEPVTKAEQAAAEFIQAEGEAAAADILAQPEPVEPDDSADIDFLSAISKGSGEQ